MMKANVKQTRTRRSRAQMVAVAMLAFLCAARNITAQQPRWEDIGPPNAGGRVSAIGVDPSNVARVILGTPAGGLWHSVNGAAMWSGLTLWLASVPVSSLAIDPQNPGHIIAGTGRLSDNGAAEAGIGLLRSTDGGGSWSTQTTNFAGAFISSVLFWPGESQRVVVATDHGIRLSHDGGASFASAIEGHAVSTIAADPLNANVGYASARTGLLRSIDRGETWTLAAPWPLLAADIYGAGTSSVVVSTKTPGLLYATVQVLGTFNNTARALLLKSTDGGGTFTSLSVPAGFCPGEVSCGFAHALAIDPVNDARLLLGGERLYSTGNGGTTWQEVQGAPRGVHRILLRADGALIAGRFGVARLDAGWGNPVTRNAGLAIAGVTTLDFSTDAAPRLLASTEVGALEATLAPVAWRTVFGAGERVGPARYDPFQPARILASKAFGRLFRSEDRGITFSPVETGIDLTQRAAEFAPLTPGLNPGEWYTGRMQIFWSSNHGDTWGEFQPPGSPEVGLIAPSPVVSNRLYFATVTGGEIYKADGTTFEQLVISGEPNLRISQLFLDPLAQNRMYAAGTNTAERRGRLFKSSDFGATWIDITPPGLPPATSFLRDHYGAIYAGASDGIWRSANDGFSWARFNDGLFAGGVSTLARAAGWLYAGTTGRGVHRIRELPLVSIEAVPAGGRFLVDGVEVAGPYLAYWPVGTSHTVAPALISNTTTREEFLGWLDGGPATRTVTGVDANSWLMATIKRSFRLQAPVSTGGTVELSPASPDGFYAERSTVLVVPVPRPDYRHSGFMGDPSGHDGLMAFAVMDRPRSVTATFEPLRITVASTPLPVTLTVDGVNYPAPSTFQWPAGSTHTLSVPELLGTELYSPVLAFDRWSDLRARTHSITVTRDTFVTDFTASYISTQRGIQVPGRGARTIRTTGLSDNPRLAAMRLTPQSGAAPRALQFVRGVVGDVTTELALVPSAARPWSDTVVQQAIDGPAGRVRIAAFNPHATATTLGVLLRDASGQAQAAKLDAITVPPNGHLTVWLDELLPLPPSFTSLLTLIGSQPLITSVQSMRGNPRETFVRDPIMLVPFVPGQSGVPVDARVQVAMLSPQTSHRLMIVNTGFSALSGVVAFRTSAGAPQILALSTGSASSVSYSLAPGAFTTLEFMSPSGAAGALPTLYAAVTPAAGQPAPMLQMEEIHTTGSVGGVATTLPRALPPSAAGQTFIVPVDRRERETGLVFTNTSAFSVNIKVLNRTLDGFDVGQGNVNIAPGAQVVIASDALPAPVAADFAGQIVVQANIPLHAVGFLRKVNARGEEILAGFPALTDELQPATSAFAIDGDSWRSEWWFINRSDAAVAARLFYYGLNGETVYFPVQ
jgi:hypothetical protein